MSTTPPEALPTNARPMQYLPVGLFGSVMGLTGLSAAWRMAHAYFGTPLWICQTLGVVAMCAFCALVAAYGTKVIFALDAARAEFHHPIASSFFATIFVSMLLLPFLVAPISLFAGRALWSAGAIGMVALTWFIMDRWLGDPAQETAHATPAWILPVVGILDMPVAVPMLHLPQLRPLMVLGLAVGLFLALPIFTVIVARLIFQPALPPALQPTLMILMAPPSVGLSAYLAVAGKPDLFAECLYFISLFLAAVLIGRLRLMVRSCPFKVGWWAVSFPLAACTIGVMKMAEFYDTPIAYGVGIVMLAITSAAILYLLVRTVLGIARGELRQLTS